MWHTGDEGAVSQQLLQGAECCCSIAQLHLQSPTPLGLALNQQGSKMPAARLSTELSLGDACSLNAADTF